MIGPSVAVGRLVFARGTVMSRTNRIKIGSLSWIHQQVTPVMFLTDGKILSPTWLPQTYIGLYATRNPAPGGSLDLPAYRPSKQFRAMTFADLSVQTSDDGKQLENVTISNAILDPGWTPPFDRGITLLTRVYVPEPSMSDPDFHAGECGGAADITVRKRHPNTTFSFTVPDANVVANGLILFRAGRITDGIGVDVVKCPYHVPWVWCEWLLTYVDGTFAAFGTGSVFPTHTFYVQGNSYGQQDEPTDAAFMRSWRHPLTIDTSTLHVYPVLTTGAPATGPQVSDTTTRFAGPATGIPYAVSGSGFASATTF
jgi:hypothetical protein